MSQAVPCSIVNGVFYIDKKPMVFLSADYPYYRDSVDNWPSRIASLKAMGCNVITFYVPWRHHQTAEKEYDLSARKKPTRTSCYFCS